MPTFLFALVLLLVFGGMLGWFPTRGAYGSLPWTDTPPDYRFMDLFEKLVSRGYHLDIADIRIHAGDHGRVRADNEELPD